MKPTLGQTPQLPSRDELFAEINAARPATGELSLWWLGQHSFVLKSAEALIYIDPFLTELDGRQIPPLVTHEDVAAADLVCGTHDHADHIDRAAWPRIAAASDKARFAVPELLLPRLAEELGIDARRFVGFDDDVTRTINDVTITAVPAAHERLDRDEASGRYPYLGLVFECGGVCVYHAGDTCLYRGMHERLERWAFDLMLLPINGRDAERYLGGIIGNMTYQEAADLAGDLRAAAVMPTHWDMFAGNPGDPDAFERYVNAKHPAVGVVRPGYGRCFGVTRR